jgi:hypothetical protein
VGDFVWEDANANGIQEAGEPPLANVRVELIPDPTQQPGAPTLATSTDASGAYTFTNLLPGLYTVRFVPPARFLFSPPLAGGDPALDSDADPAGGLTAPFTLAEGELNPTLDAGLYRPAQLGDRVWVDANANGLQEDGEVGLPGVEVQLLPDPTATPTAAPSAAALLTTTTNVRGLYIFSGVTPGRYLLRFVRPPDRLVSPPLAGSDPALDSDADPATGLTAPFTLQSGEDDRRFDMGLYRLANVGSYAWVDRNGNGIKEAGEPPIGGVRVALVTPGTLTALRELSTDDAGAFLFDDLLPGGYQLRFTPPAGYTITRLDATVDPMANSDADPVSGVTAPFALREGQTDLTWGVGLILPASDDPAAEPGVGVRLFLPTVQR